jgi:regulator of nucleoside diphosphate kinase
MSSYFRQHLPSIAMTTADHDRLDRLARMAASQFPAAEFLAEEVERAEVLAHGRPLAGLVQMGSRVRFRDDVTLQEREVVLAYPQDADMEVGRISVLTPVGAALIGLSIGQSIEWQLPSGGWRSLTVLDVNGPLCGPLPARAVAAA